MGEQPFDEMLAAVAIRRAERARLMPDAAAALRTICDAVERLKELGWRDGIYMPKDGTTVETVEAGSTGIHKCRYEGQWAEGYFMHMDDRDMYPSRQAPLMWRPLRQ
jgi:hypothetical protein